MAISLNMDPCSNCTKKSKAAQTLGSTDLERMGYNCNPVTFKKGDTILIQDTQSYSIVYLKEGLVKVHIMGPERDQIIKIAKGPCYLGIPTTIGSKTHHYSTTAITKTQTCFIDLNFFKDLITKNGHFGYEIIRELSANELYYYRKSINQLQKQGPGKLAEAILYFAETIFENMDFELPLTRNELGDLTCTSRETVSRILSDFSDHGLIKVDKKMIKILQPDKLRLISDLG